MPSTFFGLDIAVSGMHAYGAALNTTGHNVANIGTEGYTKQTVKQTASDAYSVGASYGMLGTGVTATDIVSARDIYYDMKYWSNNSTYGKYNVQNYYLKNIESYIYTVDDETGGVTTSIDSFFNTLTGLTTSVEDINKRTQALVCADTLTTYLCEVGSELQLLQKEINNEVKSTVDAINSYAKEIASLTKQINTLEVYGTTANDLRDQRAQKIDELSSLVSVDAQEHIPPDGEGTKQYIVTIGGTILVDTYNANELILSTNTTTVNQNDAEGLYSISWDNGQDFNMNSKILGGKLQGLLELRDGNNDENFRGTLTGVSQKDAEHDNKATVTIKSSDVSKANASDLNLLNIPESKGLLTISNLQFSYDSFDVKIEADGTYTYTFVLTEPMSDGTAQRVGDLADKEVTSRIGDAVDFKGIPYYMAELNEFARVFSASYNEVHNQGYDLNGDKGQDLFVGKHPSSGEDYDLDEWLRHSDDGNYYLNGHRVIDTTEQAALTAAGCVLRADTEAGAGYFDVLDAEGKVTEKVYVRADNTPMFSFSSVNETDEKVSYYNVTILNMKVNDELTENPTKLALASEDPKIKGESTPGNIQKLTKIRNDNSMFKEGNPVSYLQVMVARVGVEGAKVKNLSENSEHIVAAVENTRLSISGVDEDEEGTNLVRFRNLLNYQYQVISIMNQVLDKLINQTAI